MTTKEKIETPPAPSGPVTKRIRLTKSQVKIYASMREAQNAARNALTSFVLGILAGHDVEGFAGADLNGEELVYTELPKASLDAA